MDLTNDNMNEIDTKIDEVTDSNGKFLDESFIPYTLNSYEMNYAEEELLKTNQSICYVKTNGVGSSKIYYYKHKKGDYLVVLSLDNKVQFIS